MSEPLGDFESYTAMFQAQAARQEFADYHNDIAGNDVGRIQKHTRKHDGRDPITGEKKTDAEFRRTLQWLLANDADYARMYRAANEAVQEASTLLDDTKAKIDAALEAIDAAIADSLERAAKLQDGTSVFRAADGTIRDANGNVIGDDLAAGVAWQGDEPSYEAHLALLKRKDDIENAAHDVLLIEADLGTLQGELSNDDPPVSKERLEQIPDEADALGKRLEELKSGLASNATANPELPWDQGTLEPTGYAVGEIPVVKIGQ